MDAKALIEYSNARRPSAVHSALWTPWLKRFSDTPQLILNALAPCFQNNLVPEKLLLPLGYRRSLIS